MFSILTQKHLKKFYFLFCISLFFCFTSQAQDGSENVVEVMTGSSFKNNRVVPPAPEAASLGKFGNTPVSLFTGTPKVSVPFYELKGNSLSVPVQLSYNAAGFNPQEIATWTGLGWSLSAGGVITRSVIGNPDVKSNYFITPSPLEVPITSDMILYNDYLNDLKRGYREAQPDIYFFNFGGYSGKFMIKPNGDIMMFEKNNLVVTHCLTSCDPGNGYFTVKDASGNTYQFTAVEVSNTISSNNDNNTEVPIVQHMYESAWFLTSVTSADGNEEIIFQYHNPTSYHYPHSQAVANQATVYTFNVGAGTPPSISYSYSGAPITGISRRYLQKIILKRASNDISYIDFNSVIDQRQDLGHSYNEFQGERLLTDIKVYSKATDFTFKLIKQFNFLYSYFGNSNDTWQLKRLRLDQVQEVSTEINTPNPPPYIFEYNSGTIPHLGTGGIDHWGFSNGIVTYTTTPSSTYNGQEVIVTATNRIPALGGSSNCMLQKIKYPTGGYTSFEYELHRAVVENMGVIDIGGIRLKKMIDYSAENQKAVEKIYEYSLENGTASGKAKYPVYKSVSSFRAYIPPVGAHGWFNPCNMSNYSDKIITTISASSIMGLGSVMGSHIGYSRVTEKQVDIATGQALGKTVYEYEMGGNWGEMQNENVKNGELLKQIVYDNGDKIIQSIENVYETKPYPNGFNITAISIMANPEQDNKKYLIRLNEGGIISFPWTISPGCISSGTIEASREYKVKSFPYGITYQSDNRKLVQQIIKTYDQVTSSYLTSVKNILYENPVHSLPTTIEQKTNNNEVVITKKKYPQDYTVNGFNDLNATGIAYLKESNIVGAEIETYQYRQNTDGSNKRYLGGTISNYLSGLPYPVYLWQIETANPLSSFQPSTVNTSNVFIIDPNYKQAGSFQYLGGVISQQTKTNDITTSYIWAYKDNLPVAEVVNASTSSIAYTSFETDEGGNWNSNNGFVINRVLGGLTGNYSFSLSSGTTFSKSGLPSKKYIVSYWSKNGQLSISPTPSKNSTGQTVGLYTYYEHLLPLTTSVTIQGIAVIDELRLYPENALMSTTTYNYYTGQVSSQCSPANKIVRFEYDGMQRLKNILDENGNIVKNYKYNYGTVNTTTASPQTLFYSAVAQQTFLKEGCPYGSSPQPYTYIVPYGKYVSVNNQTEANNKATADVAANGQAAANANGLCYFWNTEQKKRFFKNNCQPWEGSGSAYWYTIPANTYWSLLSIADANAKAWVDINANGQNAANANSTCSCTMEGYRFINGVCEQGGINYVGYSYEPNCAPGMNYRCYYVYIFSDGYQSPVYSMCSANAPCQNY